MNRNNYYLIFSFVLFIFFLLPWIYLMNFPVLQIDDFCRTGHSILTYFSGLKDWYLTHNGRYVNAIVSLLPVYDLRVYRFLLILLFFLLGYSIYFFLKSILNISSSIKQSPLILFFSIIILIVIVAHLHDVNGFLYWYAAATVYQFSTILFLFFVSNLAIYWYKKKLHYIKLLVLVILINGNLELLAGITNFLLLVIFLADLKRSKQFNFRIISLNLFSWISTLLLVFAPGMVERRSYYDFGGDFFGSIKVAVIFGAKFIMVSMFDLSLVLFYLLSFLLIWKYLQKSSKRTAPIPPALLLVVSYLSIASMVFILFYASGKFNSRQEWRVSNVLRAVTLIFFLINIINLCFFLKNKGIKFNIPFYLTTGVIIILLFSLWSSNNYKDLRNQFSLSLNGDFQKEIENRENVIRKGGDTLTLNLIEDHGFLKTGDNVMKKEESLQNCYLRYVNLKYGKSYNVLKFPED